MKKVLFGSKFGAAVISLFAVFAVAAAGCGGPPGSGTWSNAVHPQGGNLAIVDPVGGPYTLAGSIVGLTVSGLFISDGSESVEVPYNAKTFQFLRPLPSGSSYEVTITQQPPRQHCEATRASRGVIDETIKTVIINCKDDTRYAYVLNGNTNSMLLGLFNFDSASGQLTYSNNSYAVPFAEGPNDYPNVMVAHPFGPYLYLFGQSAGYADVFHVRGDAQLDKVLTGNRQGRNLQFLIEPGGNYGYFAANAIESQQLNLDTGELGEIQDVLTLAQVGNLKSSSLAMDPVGKYLYFSNDTNILAYPLDPLGALTTANSVSSQYVADYLAIYAKGTRAIGLRLQGTSAYLASYVVTGGAFSREGNETLLPTPNATYNSLTVDPSGRFVALNYFVSGNGGVFTYNTSEIVNGTFGSSRQLATTEQPVALDFSSAGDVAYLVTKGAVANNDFRPLTGLRVDASGTPSALAAPSTNVNKARAVLMH